MAFRGPEVWLWRWRRNPLKRRADAVEAWIVLGAWVFTVLAGLSAGVTAMRAVEHELARERAEWRPTAAVVEAPGPPAAGQGNGRGADASRAWRRVRWTAADGTPRTGQVPVRPGSAAGSRVTVWTDTRGRLVTRPATAAQARTRAAVVGGLVGLSTGAVPFVVGRLLRDRLERARMRQWDAEWARFGPMWSRETW
ncbi:Rv1733c family protein [Streptomyces sp. NPDC003697]